MNRDPRVRLPVGIAAFAIVFRVLYLQGSLYPLPSQMVPIGPEAFGSRVFYDVGRVMAGLTMPESAHSQLPAVFAIWGPGYAIFLSALFRLFGDAPWAVRYLQAMLGGITCLLVYGVGERLGGRRTGVLAGLLAALYPTSILFTGRISTETLATFLLWLALFLLTRSQRLLWHGLAGGVLGLACLTRPTILATLAFLPIASFLSARGTSRRRILQALAFALTALAVLGGWRQVMTRFPPGPTKPIIGASGFELMRHFAFRAADPETRGWARDSTRVNRRAWWNGPGPPSGTPPTSLATFGVGALNLVFYHVWLLDNAWQELPQGAHWIQRLILLLALVGIGIALTRVRPWAPILALTLTLGLVSVKPIEIRPNLPFMPALFLLAGLFVSTLWDWIAEGATSLSRLTLAAIFTGAALACTRLTVLGPLLPRADPVVLGEAGDAVVAATALLWAALLFVTARRTLARGPSLMIATAPAFLFLALFASYVQTASEPRWRSWPVDLKRIGMPVVQAIQLRRALNRGRCREAYWLVDLRDPSALARLRVAMNGEWLPGEKVQWTRPFCSASGERLATVAPPGEDDCYVYEAYAAFMRPLSSWPQWWAIPADPERLRGLTVISLGLDASPDGGAAAIPVGATLSRDSEQSVYGPSPRGLRPNTWTSLYRWQVVDDWRIWEETPVRSVETRAGLLETAAPGARGPEASWLAANQLHLNVRLLVLEDSGRWVVY